MAKEMTLPVGSVRSPAHLLLVEGVVYERVDDVVQFIRTVAAVPTMSLDQSMVLDEVADQIERSAKQEA